jgi:hypothetical protein
MPISSTRNVSTAPLVVIDVSSTRTSMSLLKQITLSPVSGMTP